MKFKLVLLSLCFCGYMQAQFAGGLVIDQQAYNRIDRLDYEILGAKNTQSSLPLKFSLKSYCPEVGHQGDITSCVGWAIGYAAMTIQKAIDLNTQDKKSITDFAFSPLFIYNQIKISDCNFGAKIDDALQLVKEKGNIERKVFNINLSDCETLPNYNQLTKAKKYRVKSYHRIFSPNEKPNEIIEQIKKSLILKQPIVIAIIVNQGFTDLKSKDEFWRPIAGNQNPFGGHAMTVIGYDDFEGAFEVMNSWGKAWGNEGFIKIKYEDFVKQVRYGFILDYGNEKSSPMDLEMFNVEIKKFLYSDSKGNAVFNSVPIIRKNNGWVGDIFVSRNYQIDLKGISSEYPYGYIFSAQEDSITMYWPESKTWIKGEAFSIENQNIIFSNLIVPSKKSAIEFHEVGIQNLYIFLSKKLLSNSNNLTQIADELPFDFSNLKQSTMGVIYTSENKSKNIIGFKVKLDIKTKSNK